jgi:hypothetical protein
MTNTIIETAISLWQSGRRIKRASAGWLTGNGVCCVHNGETADTRGRAGIIVGDNKLSYSCFNCGFKTGYSTDKLLSERFKQLLEWLGADKSTIDRLMIESLKSREEISISRFSKRPTNFFMPNFHTTDLPEYSETIDPKDPSHQVYIDYLKSRSITVDDYKFYISPEAEGRNKNRIIIPYYYQEQLVGNTSRFLDDRKPKYISDQQRGFVFNIDGQRKDSQVCIVVEGQFDAISIGGCAVMGNTILDEQASILNKLYRKIIVVPDRDKTGMNICDRALELNYSVSIPPWNDDIKDVNDAVKFYGRLPTLLSILQHETTNKIKIEMMRKRLK